MSTRIEWTEETWNPAKGCTRVSAGCANCYAERMAIRLKGRKARGYDDGFEPKILPWQLAKPIKWRAPRSVFVVSMGDLFHESIPFEYVEKVFAIMTLAPQHTYQVLTKRPERMREFFARYETYPGGKRPVFHLDSQDVALVKAAMRPRDRAGFSVEDDGDFAGWHVMPGKWPLPNAWLGVSAENQSAANRRVPILLEVPAKIHFVSAEPLLAPITLEKWMRPRWGEAKDDGLQPLSSTCLDWVIAGGETGPRARQPSEDWFVSLMRECKSGGVPFFFKRLGGKGPRSKSRKLQGWKFEEMPDAG